MSLEIKSKQENKQESWLVASRCNQQTASDQIATYLGRSGEAFSFEGRLIARKETLEIPVPAEQCRG